MKAQAHQNQSNFSGLSGLMGGQVGDFFKNDPLTLLQSGFSDLAMNKDSQIVRILFIIFPIIFFIFINWSRLILLIRVDKDSKQVNNQG